MSDFITVEIVYALPHEQALITLRLKAGTTVGEAIAASGITKQYPEIDCASSGVFGKGVHAGAVLRDHDRVEIYRSLTADAKEARRRRAIKSGRAGLRSDRAVDL